MIIIGIDPGTHTGLGVYNTQTSSFELIRTCKIHHALELVLMWSKVGDVLVVFEDARLATKSRFTKSDQAKKIGFGSIKRDCVIWEDFLIDNSIPYQKTRPAKHLNSLCKDPNFFSSQTGYKGRTSHHSRIASMLAFNRQSKAA